MEMLIKLQKIIKTVCHIKEIYTEKHYVHKGQGNKISQNSGCIGVDSAKGSFQTF